MSPNQAYYLDCLMNKIKPSSNIDAELEEVIAKDNKYVDENGEPTERSIRILEEFHTFTTKKKKEVVKTVLGEEFLKNVNLYREQFPAKRLPTKEYGRQSVEELKDKFVWFFKTYPQYTWELVIDAANYYVYLKAQQPVPYEYMMNSSYFIKKTNPVTKEVRSALADACQELLDNPTLL